MTRNDLHRRYIEATGQNLSLLLASKKRKDFPFRRQFNDKPSIIPGCPGAGVKRYDAREVCGKSCCQSGMQ